MNDGTSFMNAITIIIFIKLENSPQILTNAIALNMVIYRL